MAASESTRILEQICSGDRSSVDRLFALVYRDLHALSQKYVRQLAPGATVQPTEIVHEAFLKLVDQNQANWRGKSHFMAVSATAMRQILVDLARSKGSLKRGGQHRRVSLDQAITVSTCDMDDVLDVDEAIVRLAAFSELQAQLVELRYFGGMTVAEAAESLGVSKRKAEEQWTFAKAWLRRELSRGHDDDG